MKPFSRPQLINSVFLLIIGLYAGYSYPNYTINIFLSIALGVGFQLIPNSKKLLKGVLAVAFLISAVILAFELWGKG